MRKSAPLRHESGRQAEMATPPLPNHGQFTIQANRGDGPLIPHHISAWLLPPVRWWRTEISSAARHWRKSWPVEGALAPRLSLSGPRLQKGSASHGRLSCIVACRGRIGGCGDFRAWFLEGARERDGDPAGSWLTPGVTVSRCLSCVPCRETARLDGSGQGSERDRARDTVALFRSCSVTWGLGVLLLQV